jgi:hypothetical protein
MAASWPKPTEAERAHHTTALCKDAVIFAGLVYALLQFANSLPGLPAEDVAVASSQTATPLPLLYACAIVVTLTKGDLTGLPPPSKGEPKWDTVSSPLGHFGYFTLQSLFLQTAYLCLKAYAIYTSNSRVLELCLVLSVWTNTQGVALTLLFFKLNWFESNWIREVKIPLEKKFPGISKIWLLGHVPSFFLGLIDAWSTDPRLIKTYGADLRTIVRFAFCYGAAYLCWAKFWQFYTGGTCIYPFVKDLNSALKCLGFVLVVGVAVSAMAFGVHQISLL